MIYPELRYDFSLPIGSIITFPGEIYDLDTQSEKTVLKEFIRLGGLCEANGCLLKKNDFNVLYEILGDKYSYQNDSSDSFRIPDLRGLFIRGVQNSSRNNPNYTLFDDKDSINGERLTYSTLKKASYEKNKELVGTLQEEEFKKHNHNITDLVQIVGGNQSPVGKALGSGTPMSQYTELSDERGVETRPNNISLYFLIKIEKSHLRPNIQP